MTNPQIINLQQLPQNALQGINLTSKCCKSTVRRVIFDIAIKRSPYFSTTSKILELEKLSSATPKVNRKSTFSPM